MSTKEWLEYQEHRERWTHEMQRILDKHIKKMFPIPPLRGIQPDDGLRAM